MLWDVVIWLALMPVAYILGLLQGIGIIEEIAAIAGEKRRNPKNVKPARPEGTDGN